MRLVPPLVAPLLPACVDMTRPPVSFELARDSAELGEVSYRDPAPTGQLSLINTGGVVLVVTPLALEGAGDSLVEFPREADYTEVPVASALSLEIALVDPAGAWVSGEYAPKLILEIGSFWDDPRAWGEDPNWEAIQVEVPITFALRCDLDDDGFEADDCAGEDCDDGDSDTWPGAPETAGDGIDRNCDGVLETAG